jgi:hypothetical protein
VAAVNIVGTGAYSTIIKTATTCSAPAAPTLGTVTPGNSQLSVVFTAGLANGFPITNYEYSTDSSGTTWTVRDPSSNLSPLVITGLTNGVTYPIRLRAVNAVGSGTASTVVSGVTTTPRTVPSVPQNVIVTSVNKQAVITWSAPASTGGSAITGYRIEGSLDDISWNTAIANPAAGATSSTVSSYNNSVALINGNTYYFRISAINVAGTGIASSSLTAIPQIRTWYFDPSGSSTNDGISQATPKLLLTQAAFGDGDTGILMNGIHTYPTAVTITKRVTLTSLTDASSSAFMRFSNELRSLVILILLNFFIY